MADIAMLVAEEYERRVKNSRKNGEEIDLLSCFGVLGQDFKDKEVKAMGIFMNKLGDHICCIEPKSQMSLAATYGFFSA